MRMVFDFRDDGLNFRRLWRVGCGLLLVMLCGVCLYVMAMTKAIPDLGRWLSIGHADAIHANKFLDAYLNGDEAALAYLSADVKVALTAGCNDALNDCLRATRPHDWGRYQGARFIFGSGSSYAFDTSWSNLNGAASVVVQLNVVGDTWEVVGWRGFSVNATEGEIAALLDGCLLLNSFPPIVYNPPQYQQQRLEGADFSEQMLRGADFTGARLEGANFRGADLTYAIFQEADLTGADFRGAAMTHVTLREANLRQAVMVDVNLTCAYMGNTVVEGINLQGATLTDVRELFHEGFYDECDMLLDGAIMPDGLPFPTTMPNWERCPTPRPNRLPHLPLATSRTMK